MPIVGLPRSFRLVTPFLAALFLACQAAPQAPRVRVEGSIEGVSEPVVFVTSSDSAEPVAKLLAESGVNVARAFPEANLALDAEFGRIHEEKGCGRYRVVRFSLFRGLDRVVRVTASGWTGTCEGGALRQSVDALRDLLIGPAS